MKIEKFEDIKAWQEARILVNSIFDMVKESKQLEREYRFKDPLTSAAISIMANIAEGFARRYNKEFVQFLFISKGSIAELQSHLYLNLDQKFITREKFNAISNQIDKVARLTSNFISYLLKHN